MTQHAGAIQVQTHGQGLYDCTGQVAAWLDRHPVQTGLLTLFLQHTSASLLVQENADPDVVHDLKVFFRRIAPDDPRLYRHTVEGPDDMPAHIRAALTQTQISVPVINGRMALGTWQGIYVFEHRDSPHRRTLLLHLLGDRSDGSTAVPGG